MSKVLKERSFDFAVQIVRLNRTLIRERKEFVLSRQLLKSGTSIGAMVCESVHAESKANFIHKLAIAQKEINETIYWLELLNRTESITDVEFKSVHPQAVELMKLTASIIKSIKMKLN